MSAASGSWCPEAVITSASTPCIPHTTVLIFHDQVYQLSSPPTYVSMLSKPHASSCGPSMADCCVGGANCDCCCCCSHCRCLLSYTCCCIACMNCSSVTEISILRETLLRYHVKRLFSLSQSIYHVKVTDGTNRYDTWSSQCPDKRRAVKCKWKWTESVSKSVGVSSQHVSNQNTKNPMFST